MAYTALLRAAQDTLSLDPPAPCACAFPQPSRLAWCAPSGSAHCWPLAFLAPLITIVLPFGPAGYVVLLLSRAANSKQQAHNLPAAPQPPSAEDVATPALVHKPLPPEPDAADSIPALPVAPDTPNYARARGVSESVEAPDSRATWHSAAQALVHASGGMTWHAEPSAMSTPSGPVSPLLRKLGSALSMAPPPAAGKRSPLTGAGSRRVVPLNVEAGGGSTLQPQRRQLVHHWSEHGHGGGLDVDRPAALGSHPHSLLPAALPRLQASASQPGAMHPWTLRHSDTQADAVRHGAALEAPSERPPADGSSAAAASPTRPALAASAGSRPSRFLSQHQQPAARHGAGASMLVPSPQAGGRPCSARAEQRAGGSPRLSSVEQGQVGGLAQAPSPALLGKPCGPWPHGNDAPGYAPQPVWSNRFGPAHGGVLAHVAPATPWAGEHATGPQPIGEAVEEALSSSHLSGGVLLAAASQTAGGANASDTATARAARTLALPSVHVDSRGGQAREEPSAHVPTHEPSLLEPPELHVHVYAALRAHVDGKKLSLALLLLGLAAVGTPALLPLVAVCLLCFVWRGAQRLYARCGSCRRAARQGAQSGSLSYAAGLAVWLEAVLHTYLLFAAPLHAVPLGAVLTLLMVFAPYWGAPSLPLLPVFCTCVGLCASVVGFWIADCVGRFRAWSRALARELLLTSARPAAQL